MVKLNDSPDGTRTAEEGQSYTLFVDTTLQTLRSAGFRVDDVPFHGDAFEWLDQVSKNVVDQNPKVDTAMAFMSFEDGSITKVTWYIINV